MTTLRDLILRYNPFDRTNARMHFKLYLRIIYTICLSLGLAAIIFEITVYGHQINDYDTDSYHSSLAQLLNGQPGLWRTPLYCLDLLLFHYIMPAHIGDVLSMCLNLAVFTVAINRLSRLALMIMPRHYRTAIAVAALFGVWPTLMLWIMVNLPESLTISLMVFTVYRFTAYLRSNKSSDAWLTMLWGMLLIGLKPIYLYLIPVMTVAWIVMLCQRKRGAMAGIAGTVIITASTAFYISEMNRTYGAPIPSVVTLVNDYYVLLHHKMVDIDSICDTKFRADMQASRDSLSDETNYWFPLVTNIEANIPAAYAERQRAIASHPDRLPEAWLDHSVRFAISTPWFGYWRAFRFLNLLPIYLGYIYIILIAYIPWFLCRKRLKTSAITQQTLFIWIITSAHTAVTVIGAMSCFSRLEAPVFSLITLLGAKIAVMARQWIKTHKTTH